MITKAVVLLSGGQDSTTVLAQAAQELGPDNVYPIHISYGQRHRVEEECAEFIAKTLTVNPLVFFGVDYLSQLADSALLDETKDVSLPHRLDADLPASFVPNRNATFLTLAHSYAMKIGASIVYGGMCQEDYSGYPDCRQTFISVLETALNLGAPKNVTFRTPLMNLDKAGTFRLAAELGVLELVVEHSHTCYLGVHETGRAPRFDWGHGCGECPACKVRSNGWKEYTENL